MATPVLITGASGLIGARVMAALAAAGVAAESIEVIEPGIDLLRPGEARRIVESYSPPVLLHLAWVASGTPGYRNHPDNARWAEVTPLLAARCVERGVLFIGTGTVAETQLAVTDEYVRAKKAVRDQLDGLIGQGRIGWLQPHYVFDPVLGRPEVVRVIRDALAAGRQPVLSTPGAAHDFILVDDVATAVDLVVRRRLTGLIPIGAGRLHCVAELATAMGAQARDVPAAARTSGEVADISRLRELGWAPRLTEEFFHDR